MTRRPLLATSATGAPTFLTHLLLLPRTLFSVARYNVASQLFVVDQLPQRVAALTQLLQTPGPAWANGGKPVVMLVHCSAG